MYPLGTQNSRCSSIMTLIYSRLYGKYVKHVTILLLVVNPKVIKLKGLLNLHLAYVVPQSQPHRTVSNNSRHSTPETARVYRQTAVSRTVYTARLTVDCGQQRGAVNRIVLKPRAAALRVIWCSLEYRKRLPQLTDDSIFAKIQLRRYTCIPRM
jgi:hypothetical protein